MDCPKQLDVLLALAQDMGYEIRRNGEEAEHDLRHHFTKVLDVYTSMTRDQQAESISHQLGGDPQLALYELNEQQELALRLSTRRAA